MRPGALVGVGRTAEIFELGCHSVVKVLRPGVPHHWAELEARLTAAVHERGVPSPAVRDLIMVDGRAGIVFERIDGPSMWTEMLRSPGAVSRLVRVMASMQTELHAEPAPAPLPLLADRVAGKLAAVDVLTGAERDRAIELSAGLEKGSALCHGDMHPGNVLMSARGPIVIDWYDAAAGPPIADMVRTSLLIRASLAGADAPPHLPGATAVLLGDLHYRYLAEVFAERTLSRTVVQRWESVLAVSRLAERAEPDETGLVSLWRDRAASRSSVLLRDLRALGVLVDDGLE
jgi:hypothetical protein